MPAETGDFYSVRDAQPDAGGLITCPVLPLSGSAVFPEIVTTLFLDSRQAMLAAEASRGQLQTVIGLARKDADDDEPGADDLYRMGTELAPGRILRMPDETRSILAQGRRRVQIVEFLRSESCLGARARIVDEPATAGGGEQMLMKAVVNMFRKLVELNTGIPEDMLLYALNADDPGWLADLVASSLTLSTAISQQVLETLDPQERIAQVADLLQQELGALEIEDDLNSRVHNELERGQREIWLREQLRVIQGELGEGDLYLQEQGELRQLIDQAQLPPEPRERALKELARLGSMQPATPEAGILRTWIDWLISMPWSQSSEDNLDVAHARKVLDAEHYGLPRVKERILEAIAVRKLAGERMESPVLCFVGPPGVGKTSLGESIARALGREFVRVSLGGVRDEAEIRGHRRTYIGALPGRVLQTMKRVGTINPVFMLDEIDKIGMDFRGDPADSLLEVLDPEQNSKFSDHYLEVPYDLSQVLFITTANELDGLPPALLDRLEVIEFPGYLEEEKIDIARQFLIPKQLTRHGLEECGIRLEYAALQTIIRDYTWEAGVRNLNREIANINRKLARLVAEERPHPARVTARIVSRWLGPPHYLGTRALDGPAIGMATGLVWTWGGGDIAIFEVSLLPGKGSLTMTGNLGDVMQESAQAALSHVRSLADMFVFPADELEQTDIHVHVPEGAVPKEGPSAGITLATALISAMTEREVRPDFGMTGEITLRGKVLPVGGVRDKLMAARRAGLHHVILPSANRKDLVEVPKKLRRSLEIHFVDTMQQVIELVLMPPANGSGQPESENEEESPAQETLAQKDDA